MNKCVFPTGPLLLQTVLPNNIARGCCSHVTEPTADMSPDTIQRTREFEGVFLRCAQQTSDTKQYTQNSACSQGSAGRNPNCRQMHAHLRSYCELILHRFPQSTLWGLFPFSWFRSVGKQLLEMISIHLWGQQVLCAHTAVSHSVLLCLLTDMRYSDQWCQLKQLPVKWGVKNQLIFV